MKDKTKNPQFLPTIDVAKTIYAAMGNMGKELSRDDYRDFLNEFIHAWSIIDKIEILQGLDSED